MEMLNIFIYLMTDLPHLLMLLCTRVTSTHGVVLTENIRAMSVVDNELITSSRGYLAQEGTAGQLHMVKWKGLTRC
jgi:hypothetical protein